MKRILITNDDGIKADGLIRLAQTAKHFGEVTVVAPHDQRSAASHSITLRHPFEVHPFEFPIAGVKAYSCSGTPADCVRIGVLTLMDEKPDAVFSGINFGYNVACDLQYSATAGAAFEGEFQGFLSVAFSEGINGCHEVTDRYLKELMAEMLDKEYVPGIIHNINFPMCPLNECGGILRDRKVSRHSFFRDRYKKVSDLEGGGAEYMVNGIFDPVPEEGTDYGAVLANYVSVGTVGNLS
jgi:5'-nucleotidase